MSEESWLVCQFSAREYYAIPRALQKKSIDFHLVTDVWVGRRFTVLPFLRRRHHEDLHEDSVSCFNFRFLFLQIACLLSFKSGWARIEKRNEWFAIESAKFLERYVRKSNKKPIVFAYSYTALELFIEAKRLGLPTVLGQIDPGMFEQSLVRSLETAHGLEESPSPSEKYWVRWKAECELADTIVVNSDWSRQGLEREGVDSKKIRVIPLAYDQKKRERRAVDRTVQLAGVRPLVVLFLGQLIVRKGLMETIGAVSELAGLPIRWVFVGDGDRQILEVLKGFSNVELVGAVGADEIASYYEMADIFLLPTHSDGFAITQLEAFSYGLPIVASKNCAKVVDHEVNGILLDEVSSGEIARSIRHFLANPGLIERYSNQIPDWGNWSVELLGSRLQKLTHEMTR